MTDLPAGPPAPPPGPAPAGDDHRVVAGVAFRLAGLLGVDPLWVRLAFVALLPFGLLGVALYAAAWLVLGAGRRPGGAPWIWFVAAGVVMWLWAATGVSIESTLVWIMLLVGAALALWQPRTEVVPLVATERVSDVATTASRTGPTWASRPRRLVRRQPSIVDRIGTGLALLVVAVGALVDHLNGGRLHPEQWVGAAASVCGVGLLVSAWLGRSKWLLVPAVAFAASGWLAGHAARAGVDLFAVDHAGVHVDSATPAGSTLQRQSSVGDVWVSVYEAPRGTGGPVVVDARVGIGDITLDVDDEVTVEIRTETHDGATVVDDEGTIDRRRDGTFTVGPDGPPDVIVRAEVSRGDVEVNRIDIFADEPPPPPAVTVPPLEGIDVSTVRDLGDGLQMTSDGTVVLPDTAAVLSPGGDIWLRDGSEPTPDGITYVQTDTMGQFLVLPNQSVVTPSGVVVDVPAIRAESIPREG